MVVVGAPNAGKSTLINNLIGQKVLNQIMIEKSFNSLTCCFFCLGVSCFSQGPHNKTIKRGCVLQRDESSGTLAHVISR